MIDLNHSQNLAVSRHGSCFRVPLLLPALMAALERRSLLLFGWLLLATPVAAQAQFTYTTNNGTITITGYTGTNPVVVIPDAITGLPVTAIGDSAFSYTSLTSVTIPNSVTTIEGDAFGEGGAFSGCTNLTSVTIPDSVTSIGSGAFSYCVSLTTVTIPNSVITSIGFETFYSCTRLTSVRIGNGVTSIGTKAFSGCGSLTNVTIPNSVTSIGVLAFVNCTSLTSVTIPDSVTNIGEGAFGACISLTNVTIPNSVTGIEQGAFSECSGLISVTIGNSVTSIEGDVFSGCTNLTAISVETNNPAYSSVSGVLFDQRQTTLILYPEGKIGSYSIPTSVTTIGGGAFGGCTGLSSVTIPNSVTNIGTGTFFSCTSLTNVTIGNNVTDIGDYAFDYCTSLTSVTIPDSVTNIGGQAFSGCTNLARVYFQGNAPSADGTPPPFNTDSNATAYYLPGTAGWGSSLWGMPTAVWSLPYPLILTSNPSFGVQSNQFGFTISWATNLSVVVEASTSLSSPVWQPLQTNSLNNGVVNFTDFEWTNYPSRFYRVRSQ